MTAEYARAWVDAPESGDPRFWGTYVTLSCVLTGEHRPYDRKVAYARRIIVRADIDESRRPWRRERPGLDGIDRPGPEAADVEERSALFDALQQLPAMQRKTVLLRHWIGLSVAETATELGISEGTVKSHTSRGLAALQDVLARA